MANQADKKKTLTPKQTAFVAEYLVDLNATQAAIRAGYSEKTAGSQGERLLKKVEIQTAISGAQQARAERTEITQDRVLQEYAKLAFLDPRKFYDADGNLIDIPNLPADVAAAISGMDIAVEKAGTDENGSPVFAQVRKIKLADKKGALDSVARHLGMFNDKISQTINAEVKGEIKHTLPPELQSVLDSVYGQESPE
jgi:phage terminase small subunit